MRRVQGGEGQEAVDTVLRMRQGFEGDFTKMCASDRADLRGCALANKRSDEGPWSLGNQVLRTMPSDINASIALSRSRSRTRMWSVR